MFLRFRCLGRLRSLHSAGLQRNGLQLLSPESFTLNVKYSRIVKDPVQGAQKRIVLVEVASPMRWMLVAGKDNVEVAFLVVPSVNEVKEQPGILLVELTVTNLINNQTGRPHQSIEYGGFLAVRTIPTRHDSDL